MATISITEYDEEEIRKDEELYQKCKNALDNKRDTTKKNNNRKYRSDLRMETISHYSNGTMKCSCCGESIYDFLTIDHINNDGFIDRKNYSTPNGFYLSLKNKNYPPGYQVLCYNCNMGRERNAGICPHHGKATEEEKEIFKIARKYLKTGYRDWETDRKSTRLNSSHRSLSRMPSSA